MIATIFSFAHVSNQKRTDVVKYNQLRLFLKSHWAPKSIFKVESSETLSILNIIS